jgi:hypothetical protein
VEPREAVAGRRSNRPRASRLRSDAPRVNGDPTRDIAAAQRISGVVFKGERVRRVDLFDATKNPLE